MRYCTACSRRSCMTPASKHHCMLVNDGVRSAAQVDGTWPQPVANLEIYHSTFCWLYLEKRAASTAAVMPRHSVRLILGAKASLVAKELGGTLSTTRLSRTRMSKHVQYFTTRGEYNGTFLPHACMRPVRRSAGDSHRRTGEERELTQVTMFTLKSGDDRQPIPDVVADGASWSAKHCE